MDHFHRFFQNLHGPQVRTCIGKLCAFTCSSNVPKLPESNASATASLDDEVLEEDDASRGGVAGGDPSWGAAAADSATGEAGGVPSRRGVSGGETDDTDEGLGELDVAEDAAADSATGEATHSANGVATDSATEDNVSTSAAGDGEACATDDGLWGCVEEEDDELSADESDMARPTQKNLSHNLLQLRWVSGGAKNMSEAATHRILEVPAHRPSELVTCSLLAAYLQFTCALESLDSGNARPGGMCEAIESKRKL